jgi:hypothetical protein
MLKSAEARLVTSWLLCSKKYSTGNYLHEVCADREHEQTNTRELQLRWCISETRCGRVEERGFAWDGTVLHAVKAVTHNDA